MFPTDTIPRFEESAQQPLLEIDVSGIRQTIDIAAMQENILATDAQLSARRYLERNRFDNG